MKIPLARELFVFLVIANLSVFFTKYGRGNFKTVTIVTKQQPHETYVTGNHSNGYTNFSSDKLAKYGRGNSKTVTIETKQQPNVTYVTGNHSNGYTNFSSDKLAKYGRGNSKTVTIETKQQPNVTYVTGNHSNGYTKISSESNINMSNGEMSSSPLPQTPTRPLYIYRQGHRSVGNMMCWFASTYCIAKNYGREVLWGSLVKKHVLGLFPYAKRRLRFLNNNPGWPEIGKQTIREVKTLPDINYTLVGYTHSYRYHQTCTEEIYDMLRLDGKLIREATKIIRKIKQQYLNRYPSADPRKITLVGVHVRRGDKLKRGGKNDGYYIPTAEEIQSAMRYLRGKYNNTVFLIASDDKKWCSRYLVTKRDSFVIPFEEIYTDFVTLALCDHLIMTQSTFAWWAGWLLEQRVRHRSNFTLQADILYYKFPFKNGTRLGTGFRLDHEYPPSWKAYTIDGVEG